MLVVLVIQIYNYEVWFVKPLLLLLTIFSFVCKSVQVASKDRCMDRTFLGGSWQVMTIVFFTFSRGLNSHA